MLSFSRASRRPSANPDPTRRRRAMAVGAGLLIAATSLAAPVLTGAAAGQVAPQKAPVVDPGHKPDAAAAAAHLGPKPPRGSGVAMHQHARTALAAPAPTNPARAARTSLNGDPRDGFAYAEGTEAEPEVLTAMPKQNAAMGQIFDGLRLGTEVACKGLYIVRSAGCSHGPDKPPAGYSMQREVPPMSTADAEAIVAAAAVPCIGNGTDGNRVKVLYVYSGTSRYAQYKASFEGWAAGMDTIYNASAQQTGGTRHIRFEQDPSTCVPTVTPVQVSGSAMSNFGTMISELRSRGYNRTDRKYTVFGDANVYCGIGEFAGDSRKTASNYSNFGPSFARTDANCWGPSVIAHELGHNLGAVNNGAPNTSRGAHCTDEWDVMCYSDSPYYPAMRYICTDRAQDARLDCNKDDYYNTAPRAGSYLANYWNMADSTFLIANNGSGPTATPNPTVTTNPTPTVDPTPTPDPTPTTDPTTCSGYQSSVSGTLSRGYGVIVPVSGYYYSPATATHQGCLISDAGTDFDLYLQKWYGWGWVTIGSSTTLRNSEQLAINSGGGYFRYWVSAHSGTGSYRIAYSQ